jgi:hypothetical protein
MLHLLGRVTPLTNKLDDNFVTTENIWDLESTARAVLTELGYAKKTKKAKLITIRSIIRLHDAERYKIDDENILKELCDLR